MMKNKFFKIIALFTVITLFAGCASNDDSVKQVTLDIPVEEIGLEVAEDIEEEPAPEIEDIENEADAPAKRTARKNSTGWINSLGRPVVGEWGYLKLTANPKKGTFLLSVLNENEKAVPVVSTANEYMSTSFYLRAGKKIIKLCDDANVVSAVKKTDTGVKLRYTIDKVAVVIIDMSCVNSVPEAAEDTIKITASIQSKSKKKTDFALKLVLDSVLGETDRHHFYTSDGKPVKNEVIYRTMEDEKWILSKNAKASMQMIFYGKDVTPVDSVVLANYTTLDSKKWEPDMTVFRSFDTVLSYNNSAVGVYWPVKSIEPGKVSSEVFYVSLAADGETPCGADYICAEPEAEEEIAEIAEEKPVSSDKNSVENIPAVEEFFDSNFGNPKNEVVSQSEDAKTPEKVEAVSSDDKIEAAGKYNYEYVQSLLDHIESLELDDPEVNKEELLRLNKELDEILSGMSN